MFCGFDCSDRIDGKNAADEVICKKISAGSAQKISDRHMSSTQYNQNNDKPGTVLISRYI